MSDRIQEIRIKRNKSNKRKQYVKMFILTLCILSAILLVGIIANGRGGAKKVFSKIISREAQITSLRKKLRFKEWMASYELRKGKVARNQVVHIKFISHHTQTLLGHSIIVFRIRMKALTDISVSGVPILFKGVDNNGASYRYGWLKDSSSNHSYTKSYDKGEVIIFQLRINSKHLKSFSKFHIILKGKIVKTIEF